MRHRIFLMCLLVVCLVAGIITVALIPTIIAAVHSSQAQVIGLIILGVLGVAALGLLVFLLVLGVLTISRHSLEVYHRYLDAKAKKHTMHLEDAKLSMLQREAWLREHLSLSRAGYDANGNPPIFLGHYQGQQTITTLPPGNSPRGQLKAPKEQAPLLLGPGQDKPETGEAPISIPTAPPFREMCHLISRDRLILCYTASGPAYGTVDDLLSMAVTGKPGRGKTTALMYYVTILLSIGAEVIIWDPHGAMGELAMLNGRRLAGRPSTARVIYLDRKEDIIGSIPALQQDLAERDALYRPPQRTVKHPRLLLADELPVLADYDEELARAYKRREQEAPSLITLIRRYVLEARKWRCFFIGSGQSMDAEILPTRVTESLNSRIVFFSSDRRARMAGLENDAIKKYLPLIRRAGSGIMIFDCARWDEPMLGAIPLIAVEDMLRFFGVGAPSLPQNTQHGTIPELEDLQPNPFPANPAVGNAETRAVSAEETPLEAGASKVIQGPFPVSPAEGDLSPKDNPSGVSAETKKVIWRLYRKGVSLREIAAVVGLAGRKYELFKQACLELGINPDKKEEEA